MQSFQHVTIRVSETVAANHVGKFDVQRCSATSYCKKIANSCWKKFVAQRCAANSCCKKNLSHKDVLQIRVAKNLSHKDVLQIRAAKNVSRKDVLQIRVAKNLSHKYVLANLCCTIFRAKMLQKNRTSAKIVLKDLIKIL